MVGRPDKLWVTQQTNNIEDIKTALFFFQRRVFSPRKNITISVTLRNINEMAKVGWNNSVLHLEVVIVS